jgi:hypothetical protein
MNEEIPKDDQSQPDGGDTLHFESRPQHVLAAYRVNHLKTLFSWVDNQPPEQRRQLLETERDRVKALFEKHLAALNGP